MESSESPENPVNPGLRGVRQAPQVLTTRGRKRASTALTTPIEGTVFRDRSNDRNLDFKRPRVLQPAEGCVSRDRSNDRDINFKKPQGLPPRVSPHRVERKLWSDYDDEDDKRVYDEDPASLFVDLDQQVHPSPPAHTHTPVPPPAHTCTPVPPPAHAHAPVPPTAHACAPVPPPAHTHAPVPPTAHTHTPVPPPAHTHAPVSPTAHANTLVPPPAHTHAPVHPTAHTCAPVPPTAHTLYPVPPPAHTHAPVPSPAHANTPVPSPAHTCAPVPPPAHANTPVPSPAHTCAPVPPPAHANTPVPSSGDTSFHHLNFLYRCLDLDWVVPRVRCLDLDWVVPWFRDEKRRMAKERMFSLLHREVEQSKELDSAQCLNENRPDLRELFKDIDNMESCDLSLKWRFPFAPSSLLEELGVKIARFIFIGDAQEKKEVTDHLWRYLELLRWWSVSLRDQEQDVPGWAEGILEEMSSEVKNCINYIKGSVQMSKYSSGLSLSAFRKLKKRMSAMIRLDAARRLNMCPSVFPLPNQDYIKSGMQFSLGQFYQSSTIQRRRSVADRNTRKWLRHLHTRRAAVTRRSSRRRLKATGHKLYSGFFHHSRLALKPDETATTPNNSV